MHKRPAYSLAYRDAHRITRDSILLKSRKDATAGLVHHGWMDDHSVNAWSFEHTANVGHGPREQRYGVKGTIFGHNLPIERHIHAKCARLTPAQRRCPLTKYFALRNPG